MDFSIASVISLASSPWMMAVSGAAGYLLNRWITKAKRREEIELHLKMLDALHKIKDLNLDPQIVQDYENRIKHISRKHHTVFSLFRVISWKIKTKEVVREQNNRQFDPKDTQFGMNTISGADAMVAKSKADKAKMILALYISSEEREALDTLCKVWDDLVDKKISFFVLEFEGGTITPMIANQTAEYCYIEQEKFFQSEIERRKKYNP